MGHGRHSNRVGEPLNDFEVRGLKNGLYRVWWKSGGYSLAALGVNRDGSRWLAPSNWVAPTDDPDWATVERMELVERRSQGIPPDDIPPTPLKAEPRWVICWLNNSSVADAGWEPFAVADGWVYYRRLMPSL